MLKVKHLNSTMQSFPRCNAQAQHLKYSSSAKLWSSEKTRQVVNEHHMMQRRAEKLCHTRPAVACGMREHARKKLGDISIRLITHLLNGFRFVRATPYMDIYALLSVKQMNIFHLGVYMMLKEPAWFFCYGELPTPQTVERTKRTFDSLCTGILQQLNKFLGEIYRYSNGAQIGVYILKSEGREGLNGAFTDGNLSGMLELADLKNVDMISVLLGALLDCAYEESHTCPSTAVFTEYADLMNSVCGWDGCRKWTSNKMSC